MEQIDEGQVVHPYEAVVRNMIAREDDLVNHRMTWVATFNGLLFAGVGFAIGNPNAYHLLIVIGSLGLATSLLGTISMIYSANAQRKMLKWWRQNRPNPYYGPGVMGAEPLDNSMLSMFVTPWILIGACCSAAWLIILAQG